MLFDGPIDGESFRTYDERSSSPRFIPATS
jgi:hypothetical protein